MIWFIGENGGVFAHDSETMSHSMRERLNDGVLRRINEDGSPWVPEPLPEEMTISALRGYRYWSLTGIRLTSRGNFEWPAREWAKARCESCEKLGHPVPAQARCGAHGYGCGLYAAYSPRPVSKGIRLWGVVEAKGRIVSHDRGFRAEYARVIALADPGAILGVDHPLLREAVVSLARAAELYAVPLIPQAAILAEYAPDLQEE